MGSASSAAMRSIGVLCFCVWMLADADALARGVQISRRSALSVALAAPFATRPSPATAAVELSDEQMLVAEAWGAVKQAYVDAAALKTAQWEDVRKQYVREGNYRSVDDAREAIRKMVGLLDDRWTRYLSPAQLEETNRRYRSAGGDESADGVALVDTTLAGRRIALVRIGRMGGSTPRRVRDALQSAAGADQLVIDLRGNLGGSFETAVAIAGYLLPAGDRVVSVQRRVGAPEEFECVEDGFFPAEMPIRVLVDRNTASAAEVLAAALRENGRAELVGEPTYGKGLVQTVQRLQDGSAVEITVARYLTPNGVSINKRGLEPDVRAPPATADTQWAATSIGGASTDAATREAKRGLDFVQALTS